MIDFTKKIFERCEPIEEKLEEYGFAKKNDSYYYTKTIQDFVVKIEVKDGNVYSAIIDSETDEEFLSVYRTGKLGEYTASIKEHYVSVLEEVRDACFYKSYFVSPQANRIQKFIFDTYHHLPDHPFPKDDMSAVFRHPENNKWYALIMRIPYKKLGIRKDGDVDIINVRLWDTDRDQLRFAKVIEKGLYPAYHMSKGMWTSVPLDETISDKYIMKFIAYTYLETLIEEPPTKRKFRSIFSYFNFSVQSDS